VPCAIKIDLKHEPAFVTNCTDFVSGGLELLQCYVIHGVCQFTEGELLRAGAVCDLIHFVSPLNCLAVFYR
jgi:hypothetical protein